MNNRIYLVLGLVVLLSWLPVVAGAAPGKVYTEDEESRSSTSLFLRPARDNAIDQLAYADELVSKGKLKRANKAYRALVNKWPQEPEAAVALQKHADVLRSRGELKDAFEALQRLIDEYPGRFQYDEVLQAQFDMSTELMEKRRGAFLFLPGLKAPERALDMLDQVVKNGPRGKHAPEAQYLQGSIREQVQEYELAVLDYTDTLVRYPGSAFAEQAAFGLARTLVRLSDHSPNDPHAAKEAGHALNLFSNTYPDSQFSPQTQALSAKIHNRRAKATYDIAVYYDRIARRPEAAIVAYEFFVDAHPSSQWTQTANRRINELKPVAEDERAEP